VGAAETFCEDFRLNRGVFFFFFCRGGSAFGEFGSGGVVFRAGLAGAIGGGGKNDFFFRGGSDFGGFGSGFIAWGGFSLITAGPVGGGGNIDFFFRGGSASGLAGAIGGGGKNDFFFRGGSDFGGFGSGFITWGGFSLITAGPVGGGGYIDFFFRGKGNGRLFDKSELSTSSMTIMSFGAAASTAFLLRAFFCSFFHLEDPFFSTMFLFRDLFRRRLVRPSDFGVVEGCGWETEGKFEGCKRGAGKSSSLE